ncbi:MAG: arabinan endo-1,5-alpha-L-arabinosidase [Bacteroidales bacterium]|nr:arabinan endo-1,5-alpha-L-arabinosidase [Bacteroidales bacterium]
MSKHSILAVLLILAALPLSAQRRGPAVGSVVTDPDAHDPVAAFCDGRYYVFTTGLTVMSSADLKSWRFEERVLPDTPQWAKDKGFRGMPWAPDIQFINGQWYLYYSYSVFGKNISAIGVATNKTLNPESPDFGWTDHGMIVESIPGRDEWNAIDANVIVDEEGTGWLCFGSFWRGIKMFKLDSTMLRMAEPQEWYPLCRRPEGTAPDIAGGADGLKLDPRGSDFDAGNGAVEAPFLFRHGGYYYLFVSYDLCCRGKNSTYKVVVGRSEKVTGPYIDRDGRPLMQGGGTVVAQGDERYAGMGHCAVVNFGGQDYMFLHGYDGQADYRSKLLIGKIGWSADSWPELRL